MDPFLGTSLAAFEVIFLRFLILALCSVEFSLLWRYDDAVDCYYSYHTVVTYIPVYIRSSSLFGDWNFKYSNEIEKFLAAFFLIRSERKEKKGGWVWKEGRNKYHRKTRGKGKIAKSTVKR